MRTKRLILLLAAAALLLSSPLVRAQEANLVPKYGLLPKPKWQKQVDDTFLSAMDDEYHGDRTKASAAMSTRGWQYLQGGDDDTAMERFNQAWLLDSTNGVALWGMAAVEANVGKFDVSLKLFAEAEESESDLLNFSVDYAKSIGMAGVARKDEALLRNAYGRFERIYQKAPDDTDNLVNWAKTLFGVGDYAQAWAKVKLAEATPDKAILAPTFVAASQAKMPRPPQDGGQQAMDHTVALWSDSPPSFTETDQQKAARGKLPGLEADQRLKVDFPEDTVPLGKPLTIPVHFAPGQLVVLNVTQTVADNNILQWSALPVYVTLRGGLPIAIQIVPAQLGLVTLDISAKYSDNVLSDQRRVLQVVPSSSGIKQFSLTQGGHNIYVVLEDAEQDRQVSLTPTVSYADLPAPVSLGNASQIKLSVQQDESQPVIRVDSDGLIHALREGTAVITGNFDGATDIQTVQVFSRANAPPGFAKPKP
jgi:Tfp pilus assembly protein PilF